MNRPIAILLIVSLALMCLGGVIVLDAQRKAAEAEEKVAELAALCDGAAEEYSTNWDFAVAEWKVVQDEFLATRYFQLGDLLMPADPGHWVTDICSPIGRLGDLQGGLKFGGDRVAIYDLAERLIGDLGAEIFAPIAEFDLAQGAKFSIEAGEEMGSVAAYQIAAGEGFDPGWFGDPPIDLPLARRCKTRSFSCLGAFRF